MIRGQSLVSPIMADGFYSLVGRGFVSAARRGTTGVGANRAGLKMSVNGSGRPEVGLRGSQKHRRHLEQMGMFQPKWQSGE